MTRKFYYMHYDNAKYNTVNAQALYKQYPPTYDETNRRWKMDRFKSRQCRNAANVRKILFDWDLTQESFEALRYKAENFPAIYDKWGFLRKGDFLGAGGYEEEQSEISDRDAWLEEQRHKWMCGESPELPEDCPF